MFSSQIVKFMQLIHIIIILQLFIQNLLCSFILFLIQCRTKSLKSITKSQFPPSHCFVLTTRSKSLSVLTQCESSNLRTMAGQLFENSFSSDFPKQYSAISRATEKKLFSWTYLNAIHTFFMSSFKNSQFFSFYRLPLNNLSVSASSEELQTRLPYSNTSDPVIMSLFKFLH